MEICEAGVRNLVNAIVMQAVKDYRWALYKYNTEKERGKKLEHRNRIGECERFFRKNLDRYCDIDGEKIIEKLREDVRRKLKRKGIEMEVPRI